MTFDRHADLQLSIFIYFLFFIYKMRLAFCRVENEPQIQSPEEHFPLSKIKIRQKRSFKLRAIYFFFGGGGILRSHEHRVVLATGKPHVKEV